MTDTIHLCKKCSKNNDTAIQRDGIEEKCEKCFLWSYSTYKKINGTYELHHIFYNL